MIFNGVNSADLNLIMGKFPDIPLSSSEYTEEPVEGRNGNLIIDKGTYPNKTIPIEFSVLDNSIWLNFRRINDWLQDIKDNRLILDDPERCYRAIKLNLGNIKREYFNVGKFTVDFICEPFLTDFEKKSVSLTFAGNIFYTGTQEGEPIIKVYGSGNIQLTINNETMVITGVEDMVTIDSKRQQVRDKNGLSKDNETTGDFPLFSNGNNPIEWTGNITKVEINYLNLYR